MTASRLEKLKVLKQNYQNIFLDTVAFKRTAMNHKSAIIRGTNGEYFLQSLMHNPNGKGCISVSSKSSASLGSSNESHSEMEAQSSDLDLCQPYAQSSSSGYSDQQTSTSDEEKSGNLILDTTADCIQQINGSVTLSLMEAKLWYTFLGLGTEMIINKTGRYYFHTWNLKNIICSNGNYSKIIYSL